MSKFEPVRLYVLSIIAPIATAIAAFGIYDSNRVIVIAAVLVAVLGGGAGELVRSKVIPVEKAVVTGNVQNDVRSAISQGVQQTIAQVNASLPGIVQGMLPSILNSVVRQPTSPVPVSVSSGKVDSASLAPDSVVTDDEENPYT